MNTYNEGLCKNPIENQREEALEHYRKASESIHHWSGFIEAAIKAYNPESGAKKEDIPVLADEKSLGEAWDKESDEKWGMFLKDDVEALKKERDFFHKQNTELSIMFLPSVIEPHQQFYEYGQSLGIKINDLQRLMYIAKKHLGEKEDIQPVLRWVKAEERLPNDRWQGKFRKVDDDSLKEYYGLHELDKGRFCAGSLVIPSRKVEWLEELSPSKSSQKQSLIELMEADQRDGIYGVSDKAVDLLRKWFNPPFWYNAESGGYIFDNNGHMIVEVRGWGRFSAEVEDENTAWEIQNQIGELIAKMLNRIVTVQGSDTTEAESSNPADPQKCSKRACDRV